MLTINDPDGEPLPVLLPPPITAKLEDLFLVWLEAQPVLASVKAAGHRAAHSMMHSEPKQVTPKRLAELRRITPYDADHLPHEIELIETLFDQPSGTAPGGAL